MGSLKHLKNEHTANRTILINSTHKWLQAITLSSWPFAVSKTKLFRNKFELYRDGLKASDKLHDIRLNKTKLFNLKDERTRFCSFFVLDSIIQENRKYHNEMRELEWVSL